MKRIKSVSEFYPGRIMYHVYGVNRTNTKVDESEISKYIILSKPYPVALGTHSSTPYTAMFVKIICVYMSDGEERSYETETSIADCGVFDGAHQHRSAHNLNRVMPSKEDAMMFLQELRDDKFSDPDDAAYAERITAQDHFEQQEMNDWSDFWYED
ncbi:Hypothetical protein KNT65_gp114 [Escherichia phage EcS1]|uniref:Uncharacterized protein n=1 Tax=Escherichia phage EcS1 TaxID=2083276 RepID=A0A2Z5ZCN7_9CAUD|nr:Hypothetical protein KNT65_gp114 [Escherichia phage EcS1]BBC78162.1 Hypothetical protein [Escherichia phage EcS1]